DQDRFGNWAIHNGPSGVVTIDVDPRNGGSEGLIALLARPGRGLPHTPMERRASGGPHLHFRLPAGVMLPKTSILLAPGVELLSGNHLVYMPPTLHKSGEYHKWILDPWNTPLAELPAWVIDLVAELTGVDPRAPVPAAPPAAVCPGVAAPLLGAVPGYEPRRCGPSESGVVTRAWAYVERMPIAVEGQNGSRACMNVARALIWGFALSRDEAWPIISAWSDRCLPPW